MPGPMPARDADLSRDRARRGAAGGNAGVAATQGVLRPVSIPDPDPEWGAVAVMAYNSLISSGISDFYQDSDWAYAWIVLGELDIYRRRGPIMVKDPDSKKYVQAVDDDGEPLFYDAHKPSGQMFQAIMAAMTSLGMTEGDRRRMRIELTEPEDTEQTAEVTAIDEYKRGLGLVKD